MKKKTKNRIMHFSPLLYKEDETVASKYVAKEKTFNKCKTEAEMESNLIKQLASYGYEYAKINNSEQFIDNLRQRIEELNIHEKEGLNEVPFTDNEWDRFYNEKIANPSFGVLEKTSIIQDNPVQSLVRDNGTDVNIKLFDKEDLSKNFLQVINQFDGNKISTGAKYDNIYDVTILFNGLPLVHIELKRRGVALKEAYNQIDRYQRDSFWAGTGLFEYVQIFIISNGANTRYYANTVREKQVGMSKKKVKYSTFEQTSAWADGENTPINDLFNFAATFLSPTTIRNMLGKYCIFDTEHILRVLRSYQICAVEQIINFVKYINNYNKWGVFSIGEDGSIIRPGGYIWHATGSGKTIIAYIVATLLSKMGFLDAVFLVVDRKDLSYQMLKEYNKFKKGCVDGTTNTKELLSQVEACANGTSDKKIIITTIQKLNQLVKTNKGLDIYGKKVVFIFDECHRSQFGSMHNSIAKTFKKCAIFGFTGTPIFAENCKKDKGDVLTTERVFGRRLHQYITIDAINDGNVLPWRCDMYKTFDDKILHDETVEAIDTDSIILSNERVGEITKKILNDYNRLTHRGQTDGDFGGMFAVDSIKAAKRYYLEFKKLQEKSPNKLKVATIFTSFVNEEDEELSEDITSLDGLDKNSLDFLNDVVLKDYNEMFGTSFSTKTFNNYYKDLSRRIRGVDDDGNKLPLEERIDLAIVVDMLITGFDAPRLNTIWLDKNLKYQRLIQTISRVNRLCGPLKTFGNVCSFRDLTDDLNNAINLFCDKNAMSLVCLRAYKEYLNGYNVEKNNEMVHVPGFKELCTSLRHDFPISTDGAFEASVFGNDAKKDFIKLFNQLLKCQNIISAFDSFEKDKTKLQETNEILKDEEFCTYRSKYQDIRNVFIEKQKASKVNVLDDIVFELGLLKQFDVDVDYILKLITDMTLKKSNVKEIKAQALKLIDGSTRLRSKRELIEIFIEKLNGSGENISEDWREFAEKQFEEEADKLITDFNLKKVDTIKLIKDILSDECFDVHDNKILDLKNEKLSFFNDDYNENFEELKSAIRNIYDKYHGII